MREGLLDVPAETDGFGDGEVVTGTVELVNPRLGDDMTRVEGIIDMLLDETREVETEEEESKVGRLLGFERIVGIPVVSTVELGGIFDVLGLVPGVSEATDLMILGSSLGSGTLPLTVHPPEAPGQAGGLNVGL